jgi:hypothetical protein
VLNIRDNTAPYFKGSFITDYNLDFSNTNKLRIKLPEVFDDEGDKCFV